MKRLRKETGHNIQSSIYTLGGFPVPRILKHVPSRCLADQPDIVVLQFGSSDLVVPVRRKRHARHMVSGANTVRAKPANLVCQLRWRIQSLIGDGLRLSPVTAPEIYLACMSRMVQMIAEHQAVPVVLSPFVFGAQRSDRIARHCVELLQQAVATVPTAQYVDVYSALDQFPRREMLLSDGTHLTLKGQAVTGECLFTVLNRVVRERSRTPTLGGRI
jgi:lysophospholipase L1-like esterase